MLFMIYLVFEQQYSRN